MEKEDLRQYICTKIINATPMSNKDFNTLMNRSNDDSEAQDGYMVEYSADGKPNHKDYDGYITWSPISAI